MTRCIMNKMCNDILSVINFKIICQLRTKRWELSISSVCPFSLVATFTLCLILIHLVFYFLFIFPSFDFFCFFCNDQRSVKHCYLHKSVGMLSLQFVTLVVVVVIVVLLSCICCSFIFVLSCPLFNSCMTFGW